MWVRPEGAEVDPSPAYGKLLYSRGQTVHPLHDPTRTPHFQQVEQPYGLLRLEKFKIVILHVPLILALHWRLHRIAAFGSSIA